MKLKIASTLYRTATFERVEGEENKLRLSISSDEPYKRYDWDEGEYWEVLDHAEILDERLKAGMPLLYNHDRDVVLGRSEGYETDGHKCYVTPMLSAAEDVRSHVAKIKEGTLRDTSVGYEVVGKGKEIGKKEGLPVYKFPFRIFEASIVTIPADISVGVGRMRDLEKKTEPKEIEIDTKKEIDTALKNENNDSHKRENIMSQPAVADPPTENKVDVKKVQDEATAAERKRVNDIQDLEKHFREKGLAGRKIDTSEAAAQHIKDGKTAREFQDFVVMNESKDVKPIQTPDNDGRVEGGRNGGELKLSLGAQFVKSRGYQELGKKVGHQRSISIETDFSPLGIRGKVAMAQRAGFNSSDIVAVNVAPMSKFVTLGVQRLTIMDLIAPGVTGAAALPYPRENSLDTDAAEAVGERGLKPNWDPDISTETALVKKIAVTTKVPDEFLADFAAAQSYIDERLPYLVDLETERQLLYGDGLGNNIKGITSQAGVQTRAVTLTSDATVAGSFMQGQTDIQVNAHFEPDGYAMHPYDWETVRLLKDSNGQFLAGGPFFIPYGVGVYLKMFTFWGLPVAITTAVTYRRPIVGCWKMGAQFFVREGMRLESTNANEDDFRRNLIAIRAEHRGALAVYSPISFLEFTAVPARG